MKLKYTSTNYRYNTRLSIDITIPPYEFNSTEYKNCLNFLSECKNKELSHSVLDLEAQLIYRSKSEYVTFVENIRDRFDVNIYHELTVVEQNEFRQLIKNIKIDNFSDDLGVYSVCDGGDFQVEIQSNSYTLNLDSRNSYKGFRLQGLEDVLNLVESMAKPVTS